MRELTLHEIQKESLTVLLEFDRLCKENDLHYTLAFGTLIGAIRHKGFIPWDDDIDVCMERADYEKFISLFEYNDDIMPFKLCTRRNTENYFVDIPRFSSTLFRYKTTNPYEKDYDCGVFIDIYPIDYCDNSEKDQAGKKKLMNLYKLYSMYVGVGSPKRIYKLIRKTGFFLMKGISREKMLDYIDKETYKILDEMDKGQHIYLTPLFGGDMIYLVKKEWMDGTIMAEFEGHMFPIPEHYDEVLRLYYNDYMQLPPEEKRKPYHNYKIYEK